MHLREALAALGTPQSPAPDGPRYRIDLAALELVSIFGNGLTGTGDLVSPSADSVRFLSPPELSACGVLWLPEVVDAAALAQAVALALDDVKVRADATAAELRAIGLHPELVPPEPSPRAPLRIDDNVLSVCVDEQDALVCVAVDDEPLFAPALIVKRTEGCTRAAIDEAARTWLKAAREHKAATGEWSKGPEMTADVFQAAVTRGAAPTGGPLAEADTEGVRFGPPNGVVGASEPGASLAEGLPTMQVPMHPPGRPQAPLVPSQPRIVADAAFEASIGGTATAPVGHDTAGFARPQAQTQMNPARGLATTRAMSALPTAGGDEGIAPPQPSLPAGPLDDALGLAGVPSTDGSADGSGDGSAAPTGDGPRSDADGPSIAGWSVDDSALAASEDPQRHIHPERDSGESGTMRAPSIGASSATAAREWGAPSPLPGGSASSSALSNSSALVERAALARGAQSEPDAPARDPGAPGLHAPASPPLSAAARGAPDDAERRAPEPSVDRALHRGHGDDDDSDEDPRSGTATRAVRVDVAGVMAAAAAAERAERDALLGVRPPRVPTLPRVGLESEPTPAVQAQGATIVIDPSASDSAEPAVLEARAAALEEEARHLRARAAAAREAQRVLGGAFDPSGFTGQTADAAHLLAGLSAGAASALGHRVAGADSGDEGTATAIGGGGRTGLHPAHAAREQLRTVESDDNIDASASSSVSSATADPVRPASGRPGAHAGPANAANPAAELAADVDESELATSKELPRVPATRGFLNPELSLSLATNRQPPLQQQQQSSGTAARPGGRPQTAASLPNARSSDVQVLLSQQDSDLRAASVLRAAEVEDGVSLADVRAAIGGTGDATQVAEQQVELANNPSSGGDVFDSPVGPASMLVERSASGQAKSGAAASAREPSAASASKTDAPISPVVAIVVADTRARSRILRSLADTSAELFPLADLDDLREEDDIAAVVVVRPAADDRALASFARLALRAEHLPCLVLSDESALDEVGTVDRRLPLGQSAAEVRRQILDGLASIGVVLRALPSASQLAGPDDER